MDTGHNRDLLSCRAITLLEYLGNTSPAQQEITLAEILISLLCGNYKIKIEQLGFILSSENHAMREFLHSHMESYRTQMKYTGNLQECVFLERKDSKPLYFSES